MRIRSIVPDFWSSEDIAALPWDTRLLFIGLWSYVDDNGVGRDVEKLICASLFPLDENPRDTLATVSRGLQRLSAGGQITRYTVEGKPYLHVTTWDKHQRVDRPGKNRYPLPTREDAEIRSPDEDLSRHPRETFATGGGEEGRRGGGEQETSSPPVTIGEFDAFWQQYPRKVGKGDARKAYARARRKATPEALLASVAVLARAYQGQDVKYIPHPATWLNAERWSDNPADINPAARPLDDGDQRKASIFAAALQRGEQQERANVYRLELGQ